MAKQAEDPNAGRKAANAKLEARLAKLGKKKKKLATAAVPAVAPLESPAEETAARPGSAVSTTPSEQGLDYSNRHSNSSTNLHPPVNGGVRSAAPAPPASLPAADAAVGISKSPLRLEGHDSLSGGGTSAVAAAAAAAATASVASAAAKNGVGAIPPVFEDGSDVDDADALERRTEAASTERPHVRQHVIFYLFCFSLTFCFFFFLSRAHGIVLARHFIPRSTPVGLLLFDVLLLMLTFVNDVLSAIQ